MVGLLPAWIGDWGGGSREYLWSCQQDNSEPWLKIPSWEPTYPIPIGTFESMIFQTSPNGISSLTGNPSGGGFPSKWFPGGNLWGCDYLGTLEKWHRAFHIYVVVEEKMFVWNCWPWLFWWNHRILGLNYCNYSRCFFAKHWICLLPSLGNDEVRLIVFKWLKHQLVSQFLLVGANGIHCFWNCCWSVCFCKSYVSTHVSNWGDL